MSDRRQNYYKTRNHAVRIEFFEIIKNIIRKFKHLPIIIFFHIARTKRSKIVAFPGSELRIAPFQTVTRSYIESNSCAVQLPSSFGYDVYRDRIKHQHVFLVDSRTSTRPRRDFFRFCIAFTIATLENRIEIKRTLQRLGQGADTCSVPFIFFPFSFFFPTLFHSFSHRFFYSLCSIHPFGCPSAFFFRSSFFLHLDLVHHFHQRIFTPSITIVFHQFCSTTRVFMSNNGCEFSLR